jgi:hypothetical protein
MNTPQLHNGPPRVRVAMDSSQGKTEVRISLNWRCQVSGPAVARLLIVVVLALGTAAAATLAHDELVGGVLYGVAGFLAGSRPRPRP